MDTVSLEIVEQIALNYRDLISLMMTNKDSSSVINNNVFWKHYLKYRYLPLMSDDNINGLINNEFKYLNYIKFLYNILNEASKRKIFFTSGDVKILVILRLIINPEIVIDLEDIIEDDIGNNVYYNVYLL